MDLLWMMMMVLVFLVHVEAKNVTEMMVKVKVGDDVTLKCSDAATNMYWYIQIHGNISGFIGRTFSGRQEHNYWSPSSRSKYQLSENTLVITNTTAEDCRSYTCARRINSIIVYLNTFHLVSDVSAPLSSHNSQTDRHWEQLNCTTWPSDYVTYSSLTLNTVFFLVITGLVVALLCLKKKKKTKSSDDQIYENLHRPKRLYR